MITVLDLNGGKAVPIKILYFTNSYVKKITDYCWPLALVDNISVQ